MLIVWISVETFSSIISIHTHRHNIVCMCSVATHFLFYLFSLYVNGIVSASVIETSCLRRHCWHKLPCQWFFLSSLLLSSIVTCHIFFVVFHWMCAAWRKTKREREKFQLDSLLSCSYRVIFLCVFSSICSSVYIWIKDCASFNIFISLWMAKTMESKWQNDNFNLNIAMWEMVKKQTSIGQFELHTANKWEKWNKTDTIAWKLN